jgi:hypothetical protein
MIFIFGFFPSPVIILQPQAGAGGLDGFMDDDQKCCAENFKVDLCAHRVGEFRQDSVGVVPAAEKPAVD